ncbi:MAG: peptide chain release factor N(5)-glutamine methyltransferase [Bacteroidetes bacterium]|nr:peptide chain release factor N(5)-glutamine methyltransferase [Bacteroidota bacterium]
MRIASNKISDIIRFFYDELKNIYEKAELETIIAYCFEEYLNIKRADISLRINDAISESELLNLNFAIKDLKKQRPIQYILGHADFYGLKFIVNEYVLIPRPETEELVQLILKENQEVRIKNQKISILDIGTGSGCISIALKKNIPSSDVYALDISEKALGTAKMNAEINNTEITFILNDILNPCLNGLSGQAKSLILNPDFLLDIIVSNPPYVCISEKNQMQKNVLDFEPHLALFVPDNDPLLFYKVIADFAINHLKPNGKLYLEINQAYGEKTKQMLESKGFKNVVLLTDLSNKNRILRGSI